MHAAFNCCIHNKPNIDFSFILDIIFFIYLYQRWIYRIDPKRVNEFGVSKEMLEEKQGGSEEHGATAVKQIESPSVAQAVKEADEQVDSNHIPTEDTEETSESANGAVRQRLKKAVKSAAS